MNPQILRSTPATLAVQFQDADGEATDPGTVTVTVTRADGTVLRDGAATSGNEAEPRTITLTPVETADLDILRADWVSDTHGSLTTWHEIVGAFLFTIAEARAWGPSLADGVKDLSDPDTYPSEVIAAARARITQAFEEICEQAFIPRYRRVRMDGCGGRQLITPDRYLQRLRSASVRAGGTWTPFAVEDIDDVVVRSWGALERQFRGSWPVGAGTVDVAYEHGWVQPPGDIRQAALIVARHELIATDLSDRQTGYSSEQGSYSIAVAGTQQNAWSAYRQFGLPTVDAILGRYPRIRGLY